MSDIDNHLKDISEIRTLMERSSKFLSLSGLSGISAGIVALIGVIIAYQKIVSLHINPFVPFFNSQPDTDLVSFLLKDAAVILILALGLAISFSVRLAKKKGYPVWNNTSKWMMASIFVPLTTGGLFCLALLHYGQLYLVAPATLIFYGLSLLNASKYTVTEIRYLALSEIALGLIASRWVAYGLFFWAIGFGIVHILYGILLYFKYEK